MPKQFSARQFRARLRPAKSQVLWAGVRGAAFSPKYFVRHRERWTAAQRKWKALLAPILLAPILLAMTLLAMTLLAMTLLAMTLLAT
jgi:hypothetical protein